MTQLLDSISQHSATVAVVAYFLFSVMVTAMPEPVASSSAWYVYWYKVLNGIAGALVTKFGQVPKIKPPE